ncbi:MAG: hypothetical protein EOO07_20480 [Chitinophagaceae bacterium]|nr:MAG: hypothetical protein EOO07_20480 [Chitinophagaceae bacterium]
MKTTYKRKTLMLALLLICSSALITCTKDKVENNICDGNGQPVITSVMTVDRTTALTQGEYNQFVIIKGENLCNLKKFMFNDVEVSVDKLYANNNELTVKIPNKAPETLNNKITLETTSGTAQYDFKINIPPVAIKSIENEYAPAGTIMAIAGQSFDFGGYMKGEGKVLFGNLEATIEKATVDSLYVKVPAGATQGMTIKTVDKYGTEDAFQYPYMDNTNVVVNYDDKPHVAQKYVGTDPIPGPLSGKYAHFVETPIRDGFKVDQFVRGKINVPQDVLNNPANYVIKFETATSIPLDKAGIRIFGDYGVVPGKFHAWSFSASRVLYTKQKWVTQAISLQTAIGGTLTMAPRANNTVELYGVVTVQTGFNIDISFDNWRIVAKSKY